MPASALLVIAYPELNPIDYDRIQAERKMNNQLHYTLVKPHFTLVFPVTGMNEDAFVDEVSQQAQNTSAINFVLRCATIHKDSFNPWYYTFLIPDEGNGKIIKLHDKLYSNALRPHYRPDIDFIPHVTIANSHEANECLKIAESWNKSDFAVDGTISDLAVVRLEENNLSLLKTIPLHKN